MRRTAVGLVSLATSESGFHLLNIEPCYQDSVKGLLAIGGALPLNPVPWTRLGRRRTPQPDTGFPAPDTNRQTSPR
ncbi:hypothetical protein [Streptomyces sp. NPDC046805]|uniref:hypothetical protein n=1 Tax=Streptomyces sp. NPDC046805 TaxID=3155134 RepID=UPI0033F0B7A4